MNQELLEKLGIKSDNSTSLDPFEVKGIKVKKEEINEKDQELDEYFDEKTKDNKQDAPGLYFTSKCNQQSFEKIENPLDWNSGLEIYGWGEEWSTKKIECHCMNCELRNTIPMIKGCSYIIFIDLDNFGLKEFLEDYGKKSYFSNAFLWCFYQGGFRKHLEKKYQLIFDELRSIEKGKEILGSIFENFKLENRLRFTLCGWNNQATDLSIIKTFQLFMKKIHCVVISKDKKLVEKCRQLPREENIKPLIIYSAEKNSSKIFGEIEKWVKKTKFNDQK